MADSALKERVAQLARSVLATEPPGTLLIGRRIYERALALYPEQAKRIKRGTFEGYLSVAASSGILGLQRAPGRNGFGLDDGHRSPEPPLLPPAINDEQMPLSLANEGATDGSAGERVVAGVDTDGPRSSLPSDPPFDADGNPATLDLMLDEWSVLASERLKELLDRADLKAAFGQDLIDGLDKNIRAEKRRTGLPDRPASKRELIELILLIYGRDLLTSRKFGRQLRDKLAERANVEAPGRFHPGRDSARAFVEKCGLPIQLAGEYGRTSRDPFVDVEPHPPPRTLVDYQQQCQRQLLRRIVFGAEGRRSLLCLPTGAGKTLVAVNSIYRWMKGKFEDDRGAEANFVIWIAQMEELCEQALEEFEQEWRSRDGFAPIRLVRFWGNYSKEPELRDDLLRMIRGAEQPIVLFTTYSRLLNELESSWSGADPGLQTTAPALDLLVIDEAHHAAAPSYRSCVRILEEKGAEFHLLGLTATPFRAGGSVASATSELRAIFGEDSLVFPGDDVADDLGHRYRALKARLVRDGVLAQEVSETLHTNVIVRIRSLKNSAADEAGFDAEVAAQLAERANLNKRHDVIRKKVEAILSESPDASVLYFGPSADDAITFNSLLVMSRVQSGVLTTDTGLAQRRKLVADFRARRLRVLCNFGVLTTGFDAPCVTHVIVARPTRSQVLYTQMIGRGLRGPRFQGTETCSIVNVVDDFRGEPIRLAFEEYMQQWQRGPTSCPTLPDVD